MSKKKFAHKKENHVIKTSGQTNVFAVLSFIFGVLFFIPFGPILAIVFGFIALGQISKSNEEGKGLAIAGIILGFFWLLMLFIVLFFMMFFIGSTFLMFTPLVQ